MNPQAQEKIKEAIQNWKNRKYYTYQLKNVVWSNSQISPGQYMLQFTINLNSFFCQGKLIPIELISGIFHTTTLGDNPLTDNDNADKDRLDRLFIDLDEQFNDLVTKKLGECSETTWTSDPLFF